MTKTLNQTDTLLAALRRVRDCFLKKFKFLSRELSLLVNAEKFMFYGRLAPLYCASLL